jgi:tetratricopeptide (TPR) repeat protein
MSEESEHQAYRNALSLALESRYQEAAAKLLELLREQPQHVPSLLLLGKVEYYLRRFSSSRARFEQVLTLEPQNPAAWFALQFYSQRRRTAWLLGAAGCFFAVLVLLGAFFLHSLRRDVEDELLAVEQTLSGTLLQLEQSLSAQASSRQRSDRALMRRMEALSAELQRDAGRLEAVEHRVEASFTELRGRLAEIAEQQTELHLELRADIRELRSLIGQQRAPQHEGRNSSIKAR